jgi:hypothetical protein
MSKFFDRVRKLGLALDGAEAGTSYGAPALKVDGRVFAGTPTNKSAEPDSIIVRLSFIERDLRLRAEPKVYYLKPHYEGYPCVLARATLMTDEALGELLETAWRFVRSTKHKAPSDASRRTRR